MWRNSTQLEMIGYLLKNTSAATMLNGVNVPFASYDVYAFTTALVGPDSWPVPNSPPSTWVKLNSTAITNSSFSVELYPKFNGRVAVMALQIVMVSLEPSVDNEPGATPASGVSFSLNGRLLLQGASPADLSVCWGPTDGETDVDKWTNKFNFGFTANGPYSYNAGPLALNTKYYYRYYATNTYGFGWAPSTTNFMSQGGTTIIIK